MRIWDLDDLQCKCTYDKLHSNKVQVVNWNPLNESLMHTVGFDGKINIVDVRDQDKSLTAMIPQQGGEVESASWHTTIETNFVVSTESGQIFGYDAR